MKSQSPVQRMFIQSTFLNQILSDESHQFSIDKATLTFKYKLSEAQISTLVQNGLITIKVYQIIVKLSTIIALTYCFNI